jgi:hypothetical protein
MLDVVYRQRDPSWQVAAESAAVDGVGKRPVQGSSDSSESTMAYGRWPGVRPPKISASSSWCRGLAATRRCSASAAAGYGQAPRRLNASDGSGARQVDDLVSRRRPVPRSRRRLTPGLARRSGECLAMRPGPIRLARRSTARRSPRTDRSCNAPGDCKSGSSAPA